MKPEDLVQAPYVVDIAGEHVIGGAGNQVYVRAIHEPKPREFTLVRSGTQYTDPDSDETLGFEATYVGDAYLQVPGDPATFLLLKSTQEVIAGDRLLPAREAEVQQHFLPRAPDFAVNGRIISVLNGMSQIGQYHVVVLNRGAQEGLEAGHVLAVYQTGETIRDPISGRSGEKVRLPDQRAGILMVFRTFERVSYGLVMEAQKAIHLLDSVRTP